MSEKKGNVLINGRTVVHAGSKGVLTTVDVCLTKIGAATVPIPYNNVAKSEDAANTASTVFVNGHPICHKDSVFSKSSGDEPGKKKGIRSGTLGGKAEFITASPNVFIEGIAAVRQGDMMVSNECNTAPMPLSQPGVLPARSLEAQMAEELESVELPDRIDIGHSGEKTPLLQGKYRQSDIAESKDTKVYKRLSRYIDGDNPQRYRELVISNVAAGKMHRLTLVLNDFETDHEAEEDKEYIVIPLGKTESVPQESPKPKKPDEYPNFTVPLVLKRYGTSDLDKSKAKELRSGWLYIFCNGYLWRELQMTEDALCRDVNLRRYQGDDFRPASGSADSRVIVPWKINNQKPTIEIAFSEVQWSWARINAQGGMNPDTDYETRLKPGTPLSKASKSEAASLRSARMQDITDELNRWILSDGQETENIQTVDDVTAKIYTLQLNKQSKLPVVFLQDPLALLREMAFKAHQAALELKKLQDEGAHKRAVADMAQSIIKSYPGYDKHIRSLEDMEVFCSNYDVSFKDLQIEYNTAQDALIRIIKDERPVFESIWQDYENKNKGIPGHQQDLEEVWYSILSGISPWITKEQASGQADHVDNPDRITELLGSFENPTPEGKVFVDQVLLVNDRLTGHTDNLVGLLANYLAKQDSPDVIDQVCERYRLSNIKVTRDVKEIVVVPGNYIDNLPSNIGWGTAIDAVTGEPVTAIKGGSIVMPQLFINGKPINTLETVVEETNFEMVRQTVRKRIRVRLREETIEKVHKGFRGLQALNICWALKDLSKQIFNNDRSSAAITAYSANLLSDALGLLAMYEKKYAAFFARTASETIAHAYARMFVGFLNAGSGLLLSVFESKMAFDEWQSGDTDAAVARGGMAIGSLLFAIGSVGEASVAAAEIVAETGAAAGFIARVAVLARFAPALKLLGWVGVGLIVGGTIYNLFADDTPVEEWLEHCAWGNHAYRGKGAITNRNGEKEKIDYSEWKDHPDDELAAVYPLMVGYVAETKWFDYLSEKINSQDDGLPYSGGKNYPYKYLGNKNAPQGFELSVTVPHFKNGKLTMQLSFINALKQSSPFFTETRCAKSYQHSGPAQNEDMQTGSSPMPITHSWGIGLADIPDDAVEAEITLWLDPYGEGKYLLPNNKGLSLRAYLGETTHGQSI